MARIAIKIFCRKIIINKPGILKESGPLLLACNHPNSFLDGIILDTIFEKSVYSLARGDVFVNGFIKRLLASLKILPVYRLSEGAGNLSANYDTFRDCKKIFREKGIVIIFSEGKCINEWHLRQLKKGTARLAVDSWDDNIPLRVLPVGINYSSFRRFGKTLIINFGEIIESNDVERGSSDGVSYQSFNNLLEQQLKQLVFEIDKNDKTKQKEIFEQKRPVVKKILLTLPAFVGWLVHAPLYLPLKNFTLKRTDHNDHYDSVLTALLFILYPFYLLLITLVIFFFTKNWFAFTLLLILPLSACCYVQLKPQLDKPVSGKDH